MTKCPNCGYEQPKAAKSPFNYTGYLKEFLPLIRFGLQNGMSPGALAAVIRNKRVFSPYADIASIIRYIGYGYKLIEPNKNSVMLEAMRKARKEHAWLLRSEGQTLREIGGRLGISQTQAGVMIRQFGRNFARTIIKNRTRISIQ